MIQVSQRVEWQRTTRWACCNRELAGDSFHRVLWFLLYVLWMKDVCQWTYLYRRKGKKGLSCSKIDQNPMVSVSFSSILFSSFFFFPLFPLISGYMDRFEFLFRVSWYWSYVMQRQNTVDVKVSHAICLFSISYHVTIMWTRTTYERVYHRKNVLII